MSGPNEGNTSAFTGRVISPNVRKRTYPKILRESSALLRLIASGAAAKSPVSFSVGFVCTNFTDMHGTSNAVSMVTSCA